MKNIIEEPEIIYETKTNKPTYLNYVYVILDPTICGDYSFDEFSFEYEPFYVGKGKYLRMNEHFTKSSLSKKSPKNDRIKNLLLNNIDPIVVLIKDNLPNLEAYRIENNLIKLIGRKDLDEGTLLNRTGGLKYR
jgi:hypothetical protein